MGGYRFCLELLHVWLPSDNYSSRRVCYITDTYVAIDTDIAPTLASTYVCIYKPLVWLCYGPFYVFQLDLGIQWILITR